ncbi:MAG TPA: hypothetical protein PK816_09050, partial [Candidatus Cloacimonadota bacterium]|nr:hypothetical protein [Candidatus Cloacimonadota bacterium]
MGIISDKALKALSNEANDFFRRKDYRNAYESYREYLKITAQDDQNRYRNVNSILVSIYNLLLKETSNELLNEYESYLKEYIELAKSSDTVEWANNIIEDLLEYSLEICLMKHTENQNKYEQQKEEANTWIDNFIKPFITSLTLSEKREEKIFYDVIIQKIFKERTNFERKGHLNQNIVNAFMLGDFYLQITENTDDYKNTRS